MRTLLATPDPWWSRLLGQMLDGWGFEVQTTDSGICTLAALTANAPVPLALLDMALPPAGALEICRQVRLHESGARPYILLLALAPGGPGPAAALDQGADDYLAFPTDLDELRARLEAGRRLLAWQQRTRGSQPPDVVPLCAHCNRARLPGDGWWPIEALLARLGQQTSHGICPDCYHALVEPELTALGCSHGATLPDDGPRR